MIKATIAGAALCSLVQAAHAQPAITSIPIDPNAISADGRVVVGQASDMTAAYWTRAGGLISLGFPAGYDRANATAVSRDGTVIAGTAQLGSYGDAGLRGSWVWTQATGFIPVTMPGMVSIVVDCMTRDGATVAGSGVNPATGFPLAFVWTAQSGGRLAPAGNSYTSSIHALSNDGLHAAGSGQSGIGHWPMFWSSTSLPGLSLGPIAGQSAGIARGLSGDGETMIGGIGVSSFVWTQAGGLTLFPSPRPYCTPHLRAITEDGTLAVGFLYYHRTGYDDGSWPMFWRSGCTSLIFGPDYFAARGITLPFQLHAICGVSSNGRVFAGNYGEDDEFHTGYVIQLSLCGSTDFNHDGDYATDADIEAFFACLGGNCCPLCDSADFNGDGDSATDADIESFFRVLTGAAC